MAVRPVSPHSGRSLLATAPAAYAPYLPFAIPDGIGSVGRIADLREARQPSCR